MIFLISSFPGDRRKLCNYFKYRRQYSQHQLSHTHWIHSSLAESTKTRLTSRVSLSFASSFLQILNRSSRDGVRLPLVLPPDQDPRRNSIYDVLRMRNDDSSRALLRDSSAFLVPSCSSTPTNSSHFPLCALSNIFPLARAQYFLFVCLQGLSAPCYFSMSDGIDYACNIGSPVSILVARDVAVSPTNSPWV